MRLNFGVRLMGPILLSLTSIGDAQELVNLNSVREQVRAAVRDDWGSEMVDINELKSKARTGDTDAMLEVAKSYRIGRGVAKDLNKAYLASLKAAEAGAVEGMYQAALCLLDGNGTKRDVAQGVEWLKKAAGLQHHGSMERLTAYFGSQLSKTGRSEKELFHWSNKGAQLGIAGCLRVLGGCYEIGLGTDSDPQKAFRCYSLAANQEDIRAMVALANCYKNGLGTKVDASKAISILAKAAATQDLDAIYELAIAVDELVVEADKIPPEFDPLRLSTEKKPKAIKAAYQKKVIELLTQAASENHIDSMVALGNKYATGQGCPTDPTQAFQLAVKAAESGDAEAITFLGICYLRGIGTDANAKKGASLLLRAAKLGSDLAQYEYGMCLANGIGVKPNFLNCKSWMTKSAENGNRQAKEFLDQIQQREIDEVRSWLESMFSEGPFDDMLRRQLNEHNEDMRRSDEQRMYRLGY